ncbi:glycosyltransferase [Olleya aquimaris]|uniref:Glycosyl transferase family 2 n=1 Tax=Olleya aquimaris TaxID=639310 RepID=A0A327R9B3_9FLAO|nr:glycosyltransferase [Olleya aquimaris]RAJ13399.1 glycosyl transferase family 2 [Olleya aquimaris]
MPSSCIIIPCYNEAKRLNVDAFKAFQKNNSNFDMCFVNDGSTDDTMSILNELKNLDSGIKIINFKLNKGKAEAIRHAVLKLSEYDYIGYLDADLSTPLAEISRLLTIAKTEQIEFVLGSRIKIIGSSIQRKAYRHFFGRVVATFIDSGILKLDIYDTQCGAKIIKNDLAQQLFKQPFKTKWLFDVELLARLKKEKGLTYCKTQVKEIPLQKWHDDGDTRITFFEFLKTPFDLLKIYWQYK